MNVQSQNLGARQAIANQAAATRNQQEMYNKGLIQQKFQNELSRATGVSGAQTNLANLYGQQAGAAQQAQQAQTGAMLNLAGTAAGMGFQSSQAGANRTFQAEQNALDRQAMLKSKGIP
jgi:hypothetical protein